MIWSRQTSLNPLLFGIRCQRSSSCFTLREHPFHQATKQNDPVNLPLNIMIIIAIVIWVSTSLSHEEHDFLFFIKYRLVWLTIHYNYTQSDGHQNVRIPKGNISNFPVLATVTSHSHSLKFSCFLEVWLSFTPLLGSRKQGTD